MTARQIFERQLDETLAMHKQARMAEYDAAIGVSAPVKQDGRKNRKKRTSSKPLDDYPDNSDPTPDTETH